MSIITATPVATAAVVEDEFPVGPCGCPVCEKWADCAYCGECTPTHFISDAEREMAVKAWNAEFQSFGEWLLGDEDDDEEGWDE